MKHGNVLMGVLAGLVAMGAASLYLSSRPAPLVVQGEVEATRIDVASKVAGRVGEVFVSRGETVSKGAPLFTIDSPEVRAKMRQANAAVAAAKANLTKANRGAREEEVQAAENLWHKAEAALALAEKTHARIKALTHEGILPAQKLDEAQAKLEAAHQSAKAAKASYTMAKKGARFEDKDAARALVGKAEGALAEAAAWESETRLWAPISAEVSDIVVDPGELAATGCPVVTLVNLDDVWVTFNLKEELLAEVSMGGASRQPFQPLGAERWS